MDIILRQTYSKMSKIILDGDDFLICFDLMVLNINVAILQHN